MRDSVAREFKRRTAEINLEHAERTQTVERVYSRLRAQLDSEATVSEEVTAWCAGMSIYGAAGYNEWDYQNRASNNV